MEVCGYRSVASEAISYRGDKGPCRLQMRRAGETIGKQTKSPCAAWRAQTLTSTDNRGHARRPTTRQAALPPASSADATLARQRGSCSCAIGRGRRVLGTHGWAKGARRSSHGHRMDKAEVVGEKVWKPTRENVGGHQ